MFRGAETKIPRDRDRVGSYGGSLEKQLAWQLGLIGIPSKVFGWDVAGLGEKRDN